VSEFEPFKNVSMQAVQETDREKPIDIFEKHELCDFGIQKLFTVLERIIQEEYTIAAMKVMA
jgi:hypothetical protein